MEESAEVFERMGASVTKKLYPSIGHTIVPDEIKLAREIVRVGGGECRDIIPCIHASMHLISEASPPSGSNGTVCCGDWLASMRFGVCTGDPLGGDASLIRCEWRFHWSAVIRDVREGVVGRFALATRSARTPR